MKVFTTIRGGWSARDATVWPNEYGTSVKHTRAHLFDNNVSREGNCADIINYMILSRDNCDSPRRHTRAVVCAISRVNPPSLLCVVGSAVAQHLMVFLDFLYQRRARIYFSEEEGLINCIVKIKKMYSKYRQNNFCCCHIRLIYIEIN